MGREIGAQFFRVRAESAGDPGKDGHGIGVIQGKADHGHSDVRLPVVKGRVDFPWLVHPEQARTLCPVVGPVRRTCACTLVCHAPTLRLAVYRREMSTLVRLGRPGDGPGAAATASGLGTA